MEYSGYACYMFSHVSIMQKYDEEENEFDKVHYYKL